MKQSMPRFEPKFDDSTHSKPLVSILIPAFNAERWIAETLQSATAQTWQSKEIIVVDDGSSDRTGEIVRRFEPLGVRLVAQSNQGAAAARNTAFALSRGQYIQWLDADDIISPNKIARQMEVLSAVSGNRVLASSAWGPFFYRHRRAKLGPSVLWQNLSPTEFLLYKMTHNVFMPNSAWLVSRELTEAAGPWNVDLSIDDDGEYFCRVLLASEGVRFVGESTVYYRSTGPDSLSQIGVSKQKIEAQWQSIRLHIEYLLSLENTDRARNACVTLIQDWLTHFYPDRPDIVGEAERTAGFLGGKLQMPRLSWKYDWLRTLFGWKSAKRTQRWMRGLRWRTEAAWDKLLFWIEGPSAPEQLCSQLDAGPCSTTNFNKDTPASPGKDADLLLPLVSILIPAFNAEEWISDTIRSAMGQTWPNKEIIVVDDGSTDRTVAIARGFEKDGVKVATQTNQGAAAARNKAFSLSKGEYIQWLDADDLLDACKVSQQMEIALRSRSKKTVFSAAWGKFMYRPWRAHFVPTSLWCDLPPVNWLLRKLEQNVYMQTSSWLVSRELTEAAGPWDTRLLGDDDGEYFCRVLLASDGVQFVPGSKVYYRSFGYDSLGYIGRSAKKCEAHWLSMQLHISYLRSLEDSPRVRSACLRYLKNCLIFFYPERTDIVAELQRLAGTLGENLESPCLSWKYNWVKTLFGWSAAKNVQISMRRFRWKTQRRIDQLLFWFERSNHFPGLLGQSKVPVPRPMPSETRAAHDLSLSN